MASGSYSTYSQWCKNEYNYRMRIDVSWTSNDTYCDYSVSVYGESVQFTSSYTYVDLYVGGSAVGSTTGGRMSPGSTTLQCSGTKRVYRGKSPQAVAINAYMRQPNGSQQVYRDGIWGYADDTLSALASYAVTYDANGGTGAPAAQTKWYGESLALSATKPTRTGHTFKGWSTTKGGSVTHQPGATYTANAALTLYAVWQADTWKVTYDANGGTGAPAAQTKTYGVALTLSTARPTRSLYNFLGWATSAGSTAVAYAPGSKYEANAELALYAVWELAYVPPRITDVVVSRCDKSGKASDGGTYCSASFSWATDRAVSSVAVTVNGSTSTTKPSGTSGKSSAVLGGGALSAEKSYDVTIKVTDALGASSVTRQVAPYSFVMDYAPNGSVAIGTVASDASKRLDVAIPTYFSGLARAGTLGAGIATTGCHKIVNNMSLAKGWIKLGAWNGSNDSDVLILDLYWGNGYNGLANQNCHTRIFVKNGWQSTAASEKSFGVTVYNDGTSTATGNVRVYVGAYSHNGCNVFVYTTWGCPNGLCVATMSGGSWENIGSVVSATTNVAQDVQYCRGSFKAGSGLAVADDGTLSVDNGAYVKLLWSGCTQSAVTLAAPLSGYRAIAVTIGGSDGVDEGTTLVWAPDGRTFDVTAAFVVGTSDFRVMRMRFKASGSTIAPTVVDGQDSSGYTSSTAFLHGVVGIH